ncbi:hypothetical protein ACQEVZ_06045 [Dactylosporangium sp. CA-152071]|uniref:hypothetical protein n=1 Tax=Dactylosporangium sp. CA-152071 TaxID=3239933 RepID=UPI003D8B9FE6
MISAILAGTARCPRWVLGGAVSLACVFVGVHLLSATHSGIRSAISMVLSLLALTANFLASVAVSRWRPAAFTVDAAASAFRTLPQPGHVYQAVGMAFFSATFITITVNMHTELRGWPSPDRAEQFMAATMVVLAVLLVVLSVVFITAAWQGIGVRLGPDGLQDRSVLGTLAVPWDALTTASLPAITPSALFLQLTYARPDLIRVAGLPLTRRQIRTDTVNALFLAHTMHHYLVHPERRQRIGTAAGYTELLTALYGPGPNRFSHPPA